MYGSSAFGDQSCQIQNVAQTSYLTPGCLNPCVRRRLPSVPTDLSTLCAPFSFSPNLFMVKRIGVPGMETSRAGPEMELSEHTSGPTCKQGRSLHTDLGSHTY